MTHAQLRKRLERLERVRQPPEPVRYVASFEGDDKPPSPPGVKVIRVTLDAASEQAEAGKRR